MCSSSSDVETWHRRLGHLSTDTIVPKFRRSQKRVPTQSSSVTFTDVESREAFMAGLHQKSEVARHLKAFIARTEVETGHRLKILRSN
jgi:hypothetical protein